MIAYFERFLPVELLDLLDQALLGLARFLHIVVSEESLQGMGSSLLTIADRRLNLSVDNKLIVWTQLVLAE